MSRGRREARGQAGIAGRMVRTIGAAGTIGLGLASGAQAAGFTVDTTADSGDGSLRAQIESANQQPGPDRVLFRSGLSGNVELESTLPVVSGALEILGPGADLIAIDGGERFQILTAQADLSMSGLSLKSAYSEYPGGGIDAWAGLELERMRFEDNESGFWGGAISSAGDLDIRDTTFTGNRSENGGGALVAGQAEAEISIATSEFDDNGSNGAGGAILFLGYYPTTVQDSTFTDNSGIGNGGAVSFSGAGRARISGSTFSDNEVETAEGYHDGIDHGGGALFAQVQFDPDFVVENSTFTENASIGGSGGALFIRGGGSDLDSLTVVGNSTPAGGHGFDNQMGGGIVQLDRSSSLENSIVSGNVSQSSPDLAGGEETPLTTSGKIWTSFSLIGDTTGGAFREPYPDTNLTGLDPQLGPLSANGGPTRTMPPADTSPALNQGSSSLETDQRGLPRPVLVTGIKPSPADRADGADMGAVELQSVPAPPEPVLPDPGLTGAPGPTADPGITVGRFILNRRLGTATAVVRFPRPGRLRLSGPRVTTRQARVFGSGTVGLRFRARGKAVKALRKTGSAKVRLNIRFLPDTGATDSVSRTITLIEKKPKKRR